MAKYGDGSKYGSGVKYVKTGTPVVPPPPPPIDFRKHKHQHKEHAMNDRDAARCDMLKRSGDFGVENVALFQPVPPATDEFYGVVGKAVQEEQFEKWLGITFLAFVF